MTSLCPNNFQALKPTRHSILRPATTIALAGLLILSTAACAPAQDAQSEAAASAGQSEEEARPHGWVEGATELSEPKVSLAALDNEGVLTLTDAATLEAEQIGSIEGALTTVSDGRFVIALTQDALHIVDTGVWTVEHGDHQHYYSVPSRDLGAIDLTEAGIDASVIAQATAQINEAGATPLAVDSSESSTVIRVGDRAVLLDREALGQGEVKILASADADANSWVAPMGGGWATINQGALTILDQTGTIIDGAPTGTCTDAHGGISTRAGAVFGCAEGALIVNATISSTDENAQADWTVTPAPLPEGSDPASRPLDLSGRAGRPDVAGLDPTGGIWVLAVRDAQWTHIDSDADLVATSCLDDSDDRVVALDSQGVVHVWAENDDTYALEASSEPVANPQIAAMGLYVTQNRLYVAAADAASVLEINPADAASTTRTIDAAGLAFLQEVGL
ncbi:hypothetical protein [Schaalia vaccimaxillae]|uniref:hypothetical protein n=1 Tax=Schaalia vaccimaxillae TaxID=183916 RepID=UPI0003B46BA6|nr:hypothetical protein [Schaalia vaccimaxillae]